jgi:hypothetical protein
MKQWIQAPRAQAVSVAAELLDYREAEDGLLGSVMQDVQLDQPCIEIALIMAALSGPPSRTRSCAFSVKAMSPNCMTSLRSGGRASIERG